ncbi:hypothetical protein Q5752_002529 [Cryptotrichosporon argae]
MALAMRDALWGVLLALLAGPTLAASVNTPSHARSRALDARTYSYDGLWNGTGPVMTDVVQDVDVDCWWAAASIAVVNRSSWFVQNLFYSASNVSLAGTTTPEDETVYVTLYDPTTLGRYWLTASVANESTTEDDPGGAWWHSALTQGLQQLAGLVDVGGVDANGTFDSATAVGAEALAVLTGYAWARDGRAQDMEGGKYNTSADLWADLVRAKYTPVTLSTPATVETTSPQLDTNHDYAIINTTEWGNGTRTVTARNPWGATDEFQLLDLWNNMWWLNHLANWDPLVVPSTIYAAVGGTG